MKLSKCAPSADVSSSICFSKQSLIKIANAWNVSHNDKININQTKEELWQSINNKLSGVCKTDECWLEQPFVKQINDPELHHFTFRPKMPTDWYTNKYKWLDTNDIMKVMMQYNHAYSDFLFIGPVPVDFDSERSPGTCVVEELCKLNINNLYKKGITKLGVIFNLDGHKEPGSHWVALFVNIQAGGVYYFDSYGIPPPNEIKRLMDRIVAQGEELLYKNKLLFIKKYQVNAVILPDNVLIGKHCNQDLNYYIVDNSNLLNPSGGGILFIDDKPEYKIIKVDKKYNKVYVDKPIKPYTNKAIVIKSFRQFYNNIQHQRAGSECGVYSMNFITEILSGKGFKPVIENIVRDSNMHKNRYLYYRK